MMKRLLLLCICLALLAPLPALAAYESLGKAEDSAHTSGDIGVMSLCVRHDTPTTGLGADGDYAPCVLNSAAELVTNANTELPTAVQSTTTGQTAPTAPFVNAYIHCQDSGATTVSPCAASANVAHDAVATSANPLLIGGYASAAAPTDVSADGKAVRAWRLRNGAAASVLTAGGALIGGDATNGLDVDVTRMSALVAGSAIIGKVGIDQTTPGTSNLVQVTDGAGPLNVICDSGCSGGTQYTHDAALTIGSTIGTMAAGRASAAAPTDVSADNDAVMPWMLRSGALAIQPTYAGILGVAGNGASGTGVPRVTIANDSTGILAAVTNVATIGTSVTPGTSAAHLGKAEDGAHASGDTGVMLLAKRTNVAASSSSTDADYVTLNTDTLGSLWARFLDPCSGVDKIAVPVSISTATTTQLAAADASNKIYVCSVNLMGAAADNVALVEGDTAACASPTAGMAGGTTAATGWNMGANGGLTLGNGLGTVAKSASTNRYVCLITSAATQLSGTVMYALAP